MRNKILISALSDILYHNWEQIEQAFSNKKIVACNKDRNIKSYSLFSIENKYRGILDLSSNNVDKILLYSSNYKHFIEHYEIFNDYELEINYIFNGYNYLVEPFSPTITEFEKQIKMLIDLFGVDKIKIRFGPIIINNEFERKIVDYNKIGLSRLEIFDKICKITSKYKINSIYINWYKHDTQENIVDLLLYKENYKQVFLKRLNEIGRSYSLKVIDDTYFVDKLVRSQMNNIYDLYFYINDFSTINQSINILKKDLLLEKCYSIYIVNKNKDLIKELNEIKKLYIKIIELNKCNTEMNRISTKHQIKSIEKKIDNSYPNLSKSEEILIEINHNDLILNNTNIQETLLFFKNLTEIFNKNYYYLNFAQFGFVDIYRILFLDKKINIQHKDCCRNFNISFKKLIEIMNNDFKCPICNPNLYNKLDKRNFLLKYHIEKNFNNNKYKIDEKDNYFEIVHLNCNNIFKINNLNFKYIKNCPICIYKQKLELINKENQLKQKRISIINNSHIKINSFIKCYWNKYELDHINEESNYINLALDKDLDILDEEMLKHIDIYIKHKKCNLVFKTQLHKFINGDERCPNCDKYRQHENQIEGYLIKHNINFKREYTFKDCKGVNGGVCRFDFAILDKDNNLLFLIEYDGQQHEDETELFRGTHTKENDIIKNQYCENNSIRLHRIKHYQKHIGELKNILRKEFGKLFIEKPTQENLKYRKKFLLLKETFDNFAIITNEDLIKLLDLISIFRFMKNSSHEIINNMYINYYHIFYHNKDFSSYYDKEFDMLALKLDNKKITIEQYEKECEGKFKELEEEKLNHKNLVINHKQLFEDNIKDCVKVIKNKNIHDIILIISIINYYIFLVNTNYTLTEVETYSNEFEKYVSETITENNIIYPKDLFFIDYLRFNTNININREIAVLLYYYIFKNIIFRMKDYISKNNIPLIEYKENNKNNEV